MSDTPLAVLDLGLQQIEVLAVERFPGQVFVVAVAEGNRGARHHVVDAAHQAGLFGLGAVKRLVEGDQYEVQPLTVGLGIPLRRPGTEIAVADNAAQIGLGACP